LRGTSSRARCRIVRLLPPNGSLSLRLLRSRDREVVSDLSVRAFWPFMRGQDRNRCLEIEKTKDPLTRRWRHTFSRSSHPGKKKLDSLPPNRPTPLPRTCRRTHPSRSLHDLSRRTPSFVHRGRLRAHEKNRGPSYCCRRACGSNLDTSTLCLGRRRGCRWSAFRKTRPARRGRRS